MFTSAPAGAMESWTMVSPTQPETFPSGSRNRAYTAAVVLACASGQLALVVPKPSQIPPDRHAGSLVTYISIGADRSVAPSVKVTVGWLVYPAFALRTMDPVGGVLSRTMLSVTQAEMFPAASR